MTQNKEVTTTEEQTKKDRRDRYADIEKLLNFFRLWQETTRPGNDETVVIPETVTYKEALEVVNFYEEVLNDRRNKRTTSVALTRLKEKVQTMSKEEKAAYLKELGFI